MKRVFDFQNYRDFVVNSVKSMPKSGRGEFLKIASHLGMHTSTLSQVLKGDKNFTLDQACALCDYFGLNELETEYVLLLADLERAGTDRLKNNLGKRLQKIKSESRKIGKVVPGKRTLTASEKAIFYSNWYYTGIWALASIPGYQTVEAISNYFSLPKILVKQVTDFLLSTGLFIEKDGALSPGATYVHLEAESPLIGRHHAIWRQKAIERHPFLSGNEVAYSSPMSLSVQDAEKVHMLILSFVESVNKIRDPSPCETLYFLNVDWIRL